MVRFLMSAGGRVVARALRPHPTLKSSREPWQQRGYERRDHRRQRE
jgi:hypothetical protein